MTILRGERNVARALLVAASLSAAGCMAVFANITVRAPGPIAADPQAAIVVVVQPAEGLAAVDVLDGRGHLVAQLGERSHTVVRVPEGPTILYALVENKVGTADRIEGTLIAGRIYYATVGPRPGGVAFVTLTPRTPGGRWAHKDEYLRATTLVAMDPDRIGRAVNELGRPLPIMEAADAAVAALDPARRAEHEVQESDGF